jgi:hypothetical protein
MFRSLACIVLVGLISLSGQVSAQKTMFLFSNKFFGAVSAGAGVYFLVEANKARSDGNDAFALYEAAGSTVTARELYDESKQKDTKAAVLLGLGVGTVGYGIHLLMKGDDRLPDPKMDKGLVEVKGVKIDAGADPVSGRMGLLLRRTF